MSFPSCLLRNCFRSFYTSCNPRRTILNTFATFFFLSYSKLLFTSIYFLLAFQSYNSHGERVSSSAVLLYDPNIRFFHSEHILYATVALLVLLVFIIPSPAFTALPYIHIQEMSNMLGISKMGYSSPHHGHIPRMV